MSEENKPAKKPWIGFMGLILLAFGFCIGVIDANAIAVFFVVVGGGTLACLPAI